MIEFLANVNYFDLTVGIFVFISAFLSYHRGFTKEISSVLKWVIAFFIAIYNVDIFKPWLEPYFQDDPFLLNLMSGVSLFLISLLLIGLILQIISIKLERNPLSGIDGLLGFIYGGIKAMVILAFIYMVMFRFYTHWPATIKESKSIDYIEKTAIIIDNIIPADFDVKNIADSVTKESAQNNLVEQEVNN